MKDKKYSTGLTRMNAECVLAYAKHNMKSGQAAKEMYCATGTVDYNISLVHHRTGLDPKRFYDLVKLIPIALETIREADEEGV